MKRFVFPMALALAVFLSVALLLAQRVANTSEQRGGGVVRGDSVRAPHEDAPLTQTSAEAGFVDVVTPSASGSRKAESTSTRRGVDVVGIAPTPTSFTSPSPTTPLASSSLVPASPASSALSPFVLSASAAETAAAAAPKEFKFETPIKHSSSNRINNIKKVAEALSGLTIQPSQEFSFNDAVGVRSSKKGYREATIFVKGKKAKAIGGGVCQVSSTLYNAALLAGFKVTERHAHSRRVDYVPQGKDATVCYGSKDLKFVNQQPRPYRIDCQVISDKVVVTLREA